MKLQYTVLAAALALTGCGSDSSNKKNTSSPTYNVSGTLASETKPAGAKICSDLNQNFVCNKGEPTTTSDSSGKFKLTHTQTAILERPLLALVDSTVYIAPGQNKAQGNIINGVSSLLAGAVVSGQTVVKADTQIKAELSKAGITLSKTLVESLQSSKLATLEKNLIVLLGKVNNSNRLKVLSLLVNNLSFGGKHLAKDELTADELTTLSNELIEFSAASKPLNDTGVTLYFSDANKKSDVAEAPADFPGQDAAYGFDTTDKQATTGKGFKFVKLDAQGKKLADDAAKWSCVLDERTGLIWENKLNDSTSVRHKDRYFAIELENFKPYPDDLAEAGCAKAKPKDKICSTKQYIDYMNPKNLCGVSQWRVPTLYEFYGILDFGETAKNSENKVVALSQRYFPNIGKGAIDLDNGEIWLDAVSDTTYDTKTKRDSGTFYFPFLRTIGKDRGEISFDTVYSSIKPKGEGYYYVKPTRLVATKRN